MIIIMGKIRYFF